MTIRDEVIASFEKALATYAAVRRTYYEAVFVVIYDYLDSDKPLTQYKNQMKQAMINAFIPAAEIGWEDAGAQLPYDDAVAAFLSDATDAEMGYIDALFLSLKEARKSEDVNKVELATARAVGYANTLDRIYNRVKVMAAGSRMLTFAGEDGEESCSDCQRYKGKRRKASWWIRNDAIPPNRNFECGGYRCQHVLVDDDGQVWTL